MSASSDLDLLRRYEPVVRYAQGELFLPAPVEEYLAGATLLASTSDRKAPRVIAPPGTLDPQSLSRLGREHDDERLYLQFVDRPLSRREYRAWRQEPGRPRFKASSRFASVGLLSRLIDATMRLTLLLRGKVPGGYAAAAHRKMAGQQAFRYYGHVTRDGGYVVLQYWYLYAMNDWRSTFGGVNDHEADWEQVTLFLLDRGPDAEPEPAWVAFSSHDEVGDDLRRRWDDPDIAFVDGTHPVVYAGAGSHSGAYLPGEYVIAVALPLPRFVDRIRRAVMRILPWSEDNAAGMGIPYIDYRRGDGPAIGPGEERAWSPVLIDDATPWVRDFRGLWGLDTHDPLGGERAPAGPRYDRGGTVRESWRQPVGWAGLDKEAPDPARARTELEALRAVLGERQEEAAAQLEQRRGVLRAAREADRASGHDARHPTPAVTALQAEVSALRARAADLAEEAEGVDRALAAPVRPEPVHAHLRHRALPLERVPERGLRQRLLRIWAAASASLLLGVSGILILIGYPDLVGALLVLVLVMVVVEAALRGRLLQLLVNLAVAALIVLAAAAVVSIALGNAREGIGILLILAAVYMAWQTLQEGART